ncbi:DUF4270 domain-containing protein [Psychroflexus lacisalsi]|jgi:hypothetical protein|uniref:DUF4270 domain-containing protein n=1 Tax=Psychroflexus lacisalsi TaxID=503928 RepID=A0ABN1K4B5_9FLAO|nr:DUF4270 domain-containing protein [Psychroflexus lacisalsi]MBZ9618921.1 DUF4270 domain-containing protein [Psychroflexus lacisalsi]
MSKIAIRSLASILVLTLLFSCENEYSEVGTDYINSIQVQPPYESENVVAFSEKYNAIQTNGLRNYFIGHYSDPVYGMSETKLLTQLSLTQTNPNFGSNPVIDSVVMTLPFYSRQIEEDEYELDSVYGNGSFKLNVYQSNQFLRDLDPGQNGDFQDRQLYYTNQLDQFNSNIESEPVVASEIIKPTDLTDPVVLVETTFDGSLDTLNLSPRIRIKMPNEYFNEKIINAPNPEVFSSNAAFRNYLRGFLIEADQQQPVMSMSMFDFQNADANITIFYRNEVEEENDEGEMTVETRYNQFVLNFNGIKLNLYNDNFNVDLTSQDTIQGEENIYLKGGEGSSGIIKLFAGPDTDGDGISDELEELRSNDWLINEANLDLYINEEVAPNSKNRINRVFLFNLDDEEVLEDYLRDPTASENPFTSRLVHLAPLDENDNGDLFYRIRLTSHINNVINNDSTNVRLGVYVVPNVNQQNFLKTQNSQLGISENVPSSMMETPRGIVIHGNQSATESKKMKLRIIYTETN